jgi:hypothetical protein
MEETIREMNMNIREIRCKGAVWIPPAKERGQGWNLVNNTVTFSIILV